MSDATATCLAEANDVHDEQFEPQTMLSEDFENESSDAVMADEDLDSDFFQLPGADLQIFNGVLENVGDNDELIASIPLETVHGICVRKSYDFATPITWAGFFGALGVVSKLCVPWAGFGWFGATVFGAMGIFSLFDIVGHKITVDTQHGVLEYPSTDSRSEAEGFVVSVRQRMDEVRRALES